MSVEKKHIHISEHDKIKEVEIKRPKVDNPGYFSKTNSRIMSARSGKKNDPKGSIVPADDPNFSILVKKGKLLRKLLKPPASAKAPYIVECANCGKRFRADILCGAVCWTCGFKHSCTDIIIIGGS